MVALDFKHILSEAEIETILNDPSFSNNEESNADYDYAECSDYDNDTQFDASSDGREYDTNMDY